MIKPRLTKDERYEYGRSLRERAPLESHAVWSPAHRRADPVSLIEDQNRSRIPWLVPVRRARMMRTPFTFYRGTARIMGADLALTPVSGIRTQLCGDAHLANFGVYASPERRLVFDLNDFDETLPGPWEWDVKRLVASIYIAGRYNGLSRKETEKITRRAVTAYRKGILKFAEMRLTDIWYNLFEADRMLDMLKGTKQYKPVKRQINKSKKKDSLHALDRLTHKVNGEHKIRSDPPFLIPLLDIPDEETRELTRDWILDSFDEYRENTADDMEHLLGKYKIQDFALKVVGVGSVGTWCAILLLEGKDQHDPLFLQIKQASQSVLEDALPASKYANSAERVVQGQRLMQAANDIFLGWTTCKKSGRYFYWRQLKDWKGSAEVENVSFGNLKYLAGFRGWNLARAHARSGDAVTISGYLDAGKKFDKAITQFAALYADQNDRDYDTYKQAIREGGLHVSDLEQAK